MGCWVVGFGFVCEFVRVRMWDCLWDGLSVLIVVGVRCC